MSDGYVTDFMTGKRVKGFIEDPAVPGQYLCNFGECRRPTGHRNYAVCWEHTPEPFRERRASTEHAETFDREFLASLKICDPPSVSSSRVIIVIEMARKFVLKHKKNRHRKQRRVSAFRPKLGEFAI